MHSQLVLMAKFDQISRPLAKITMRTSRGAGGLMVIFARGREIVEIFAMRDPWLASKNTELPPKAILVPALAASH